MSEEETSKNLSETLFVKHKQAKETSALTQYMPTSQSLLDETESQNGLRLVPQLAPFAVGMAGR